LINTINTITPEQLVLFVPPNQQLIDDLPAAMRDHVMATISKRRQAQAAA
jgi:hypothetical protein